MAQREALIVGTGRYEDPALRRLRSPAQDAAALAAVLCDERIGGFHVQQVVDETEAAVRRAVHRFFADRSRDDLLLVHLSCHGIKDDEGRLYFAATDTSRDALEVTAMPAAFLNDQMDRCRARSIVLLLDCCYAGAFTAGSKGDTGVHLKENFDGHGRAILTASNAIEYSWEGGTLSGDGRPSVFTAAIVDGRVSLPELHDYVTERMLSQVPRQTPLRWELGIEGGLYIARNPRPRLPAEVLDALVHPLLGVRAGVVGELERLLAASPPVAQEARAALERLLDDDSRTVRQAAAEALGTSGPAPGAEQQKADPTERQEAERQEAERQEAERQEAEQQKADPTERQEAERQDLLMRLKKLVAALRRRPLLSGGLALILVLAWMVVGDSDVTVQVSSQEQWTDTGIDLEDGQVVEIFATGTVCDNILEPDDCWFGPDGEEDVHGAHSGDPFEANHAALVATTDPEGGGRNERVIEIGSHGFIDVSDVIDPDGEAVSGRTFPGRLLLGINDGRLDDNTGAYEARIRVTRARD